jgi:putative restriction endonuclease
MIFLASPILVRPRLGQGAFRVSVTDAYNRACAVTAEHSLPALEAAHIRPFAKDGPHEVRNGLLLRADLHRLFEQGYLTVTPNHELWVSDRLRNDYHNGRSYYPLRGTRIAVPNRCSEQPAADLLDWHNRNVFLQ